MRLLSVSLLLTAGALYAQTPAITGILNAGSRDFRLSPGTIATVSGVNLGTGDADVTMGGIEAPIVIDLGNQLNIQIPFELGVGRVPLVVTVNGRQSDPYMVDLYDYAPGLVSGAGGVDATLGTFTNPAGAFLNTNVPAVPTQIVTLYATGLGATNPQVPTGAVNTSAPTALMPAVTVGGETARVTGAALSTVAFGYYQVSFQVPADLPVGKAPVTLQIGDQTSNTVLLPIGKPIPLILNVVNGFSSAAANVVSPGELIAINGGNMGTKDDLSVFPATSTQGISVTMDNIPVPLFYMYPSVARVYAVVPTEIGETGNGVIVVTNAQGNSSIAVRRAAAAPGISRTQDPTKPSRQIAMAVFANTAWRVVPAATATALGWPNNCKSGNLDPTMTCGQPASVGDTLQMYVTGLGKVVPDGDPNGTPLPTGQAAPASGQPLYWSLLKPNVTVGGVAAPVQFWGMTPGVAGMYQISFQVPNRAPTGDDVAVVVTIPGQSSDSATLSIH